MSQIRPEFLNTFLSANLDQLDYDAYDYDQPYAGGRPDLDNLSVVNRGSLPLRRRDAMSAQFSALNLRPLLRDGRKGLFYLSLTGRRDGRAVSRENRFVLMTDLGLIHKTAAGGGGAVYAVSLADGRPRAGFPIRDSMSTCSASAASTAPAKACTSATWSNRGNGAPRISRVCR